VRSFKRLLVAGGAGFIGSNFVRLLRRTRPEVEITVLDKLTYAGNRANLAEFEGTRGYKFVRGDICDRTLVGELAGAVDGIVNFAAETHVDRSLMDPFVFIETDVRGTAVLCEAAWTNHHEAFLLVSTDEVYGEVMEGRSHEEHALNPRNPYSASKAASELIARTYANRGLPLLITRGSNTYGPYQYPEKLIPVLITNAIDDLPLPLYNDGSAVRDYIHVEDHCRAIDVVLHEAPLANIVYNIGTRVETSGNEVAKAVLEIMRKPKSLIQYVADRPGHDYRYAVNPTRISDLGWEPQVTFAEGLERTVRWYVDNQDWWRPLKSGEYWEYYKKNYRPLSEQPS